MILYLGLDPSRYEADGPLLHYPVIATKRLPFLFPSDWPEATHLLFTSRSAVFHWEHFEGKEILAIGEATAQPLRDRGLNPLVASDATQEGMVALLNRFDLRGTYLVWPRSSKSRNVLTDYLQALAPLTKFLPIDLYETCYQRFMPIPPLESITEIVFTSPSTVEGFLRIYGSLPKDKKLTPIGPITKRAIDRLKCSL